MSELTNNNFQFHFDKFFKYSFIIFQVCASGNFELQILEISNTNSHLLSGYCCGVPLSMRSTKTTGCPPCSTAFRLCLKEYQSTTPNPPGILSGCSFGNSSSKVIGGSSFVLTDPEVGSMVLPFTFRWTVSLFLFFYNAFTLSKYSTSFSICKHLYTLMIELLSKVHV